jgi:hypothetical protein
MSGSQISFRPFVDVSAIYTDGLAAVGVDQQGDIANATSEGYRVGWGVSGSHRWRHTELGLDYHGDINFYQAKTYYDSTDQSLLLGITHQLTRHVSISLQNSAGLFSTNPGTPGLAQTVPFDPSQTFIPRTDFFDNRTIYGSTMADLKIQKSSRLSFDFGGGFFLNRRRSSALYGTDGASARADVQYRVTRRSTIGANYNYNHFGYTGILSGSDLHGVSGTYAVQITQRAEFSGYAGFMRAESKFIQNVPLDPAIAAILGISSGLRVVYTVRYVPNIGARLSRSFSRGVAYVSGGHTVAPGNGLFLTSTMTSIYGGYTYTGLRRWTFNSSVGYSLSGSFGNVVGNYSGISGVLGVSRQLTRAVHFIASFNAQEYGSSDFAKYNRTVYSGSIGLGFSPGDVPVRIW